MSPPLRRISIVSAALPILAMKGNSITVGEVAQATGVAEATVFKVFPSRDHLIQTCLETVMSTSELEVALSEISVGDQVDLAVQLRQIADCLNPYLARTLPVLQAVGPAYNDGSATGAFRVLVTVETLLTREFATRFSRDSRPKSRRIFTKAFVAVIFAAAMQAMAGLEPPSTDELISVLLHGALKDDHELETV